jgi:hypothetical protein
MVTAPRLPTEDRRGSPRTRLSAAIVLQHPAPLRPERLSAEIVDLSPLGLSLDVAGSPVAGAGLLLELPVTGDGPRQLAARIVRVESLAGDRHRVGCELLTELSRRDYRVLRERLGTALAAR